MDSVVYKIEGVREASEKMKNEEKAEGGYVYIDLDGRRYEGRGAADAISRMRKSDECDNGSTQKRAVSWGRWKEAQIYEERVWMKRNLLRADDRNWVHRRRFNRFDVIRGRAFKRGIELGSGPFTNMRCLLGEVVVKEVHLLDPLIEMYVKHPFCAYSSGVMGGLKALCNPFNLFCVESPGHKVLRVINMLLIGGAGGKKVMMHPSSIEEFVSDTKYDMVLMVNVLEHCKDAGRIFSSINEMICPGGVFIFHDKLYRKGRVSELNERLYDAGHPLRVDGEYVRGELESGYRDLYRAMYDVGGKSAMAGYVEGDFYYIGVKK